MRNRITSFFIDGQLVKWWVKVPSEWSSVNTAELVSGVSLLHTLNWAWISFAQTLINIIRLIMGSASADATLGW